MRACSASRTPRNRSRPNSELDIRGGLPSVSAIGSSSSTVVGGAKEMMRKSSLLFVSWFEVIVIELMWRGEEWLLVFLVGSPLLLSLGEDPVCLSSFVRMIGESGVLFPDLETPSVPVPCFEYRSSGWDE